MAVSVQSVSVKVILLKKISCDIMNKNEMSELEKKLMQWGKRDLVKLILDLKKTVDEQNAFIEDGLGL